MKKKLLALLLALMLIASPALAAVPNPDSDFYVLDQANVISTDTEDYIIANNDQLAEACGAQIVFVTVDDTDGEAIDDYCNDLFNEWGIGDSSKDNGFLVLMAIDDDNYYALPGTGIETRMSSGDIKLMLDDYLEPDFADRDYDAGARKLFDALFTEICDMYSVYLTPITGSAASNIASSGQGNAPVREVNDRPVDGYEVHSDSLFSGFFSMIRSIFIFAFIIILIVIIVSISSASRRRRRGGTFVPPPPHTPPRRPIIFHTGPRPGNGPRPTNTHRSRTGSFGGGFGGSRSGGGGISRGGGAGRGR